MNCRKRNIIGIAGVLMLGMYMFASIMLGEEVYAERGGIESENVAMTEILSVTETANPSVVYFSKEEYTIPLGWTKKIVGKVNKAYEDVYTWSYTSGDRSTATVDQKGVVTGKKKGTVTITIKAKEDSSVKASYTAKVEKEKKGWHTTASGKKYYVDKNGNRKIGYFKVKGAFYYANKSSYILMGKWKYVNLDKRKYKLYFGKNGKQKQNVASLIGKQSSYRIEVNLTKNTVIIYAKDGSKGYCIPVKAMVCSCGVSGHSTRKGNYSKLTKAGKWHTLKYRSYGKYCTRYSGPYLFHSVVYSKNKDSYSLVAKEYKKLGKNASHGCVRLSVKDAKWIYDNSSKCTASLYYSNKKMPLLKPKAKAPVVLKGGKAYDPTDPDVE